LRGTIFEDVVICVLACKLEDDAMSVVYAPAANPMTLLDALNIPVSVSCSNDIDGASLTPGRDRTPLMGALSLCKMFDVDCDFA